MTLYVHDGVEFDLDRTYVDVVGVEWRWTGGHNAAGEPLMVGAGDRTPLPFPDVYRDHGPLIPLAGKVTTAEARRAVDVDYAASIRARLTESYADYVLRLGGST